MNDEAEGGIGEMSVEWHDIRDPNDPALDELAQRYGLHPLHIEDCRHRGQRAKAEESAGYMFIVLKPIACSPERGLYLTDLDIFVGPDFVITVQETGCPEVSGMLAALRASWGSWTRSDELMYRIMDGVVDSYLGTLDRYSDVINDLEDAVLEDPVPAVLERIFNAKRALIQIRRVLASTRDVAGFIQRTSSELIAPDLWPYLRDVYDHVTRNLEIVETQRDLINGVLDVYLSSVSNRLNNVVKALTVIGTIALPALIITGMYGMNVQGLPFARSPYAFAAVALLIVAIMAALLIALRRMRWL